MQFDLNETLLDLKKKEKEKQKKIAKQIADAE